MKKLLSIVLAVAVMTVMACSMFGFQASALETVSLFPASASDFTCVSMGDGDVTVAAEGNGYKFSANAGWPAAHYMSANEDAWAKAYINQECYLNWDFEVVSGGTNVVVYFCGQSPTDQAGIGVGESINYLIDPANNKLVSGAVVDLPVGKYKGSVHVKDLGCREDLILSADGDAAADPNAYFTISGMKVFAVGGDVIVNELSVGPKSGDAPANTTAAPANTTAAPANTTAANGATTTVANTTAVTPDSAQTGDISNALLFVVVAVVAAGVVTLSAVASKKSKEQ